MIVENPIRCVPPFIEKLWMEPLEKKSPRILLVDDDPVFCRSMEKTAEKNQIDLTVCQNIGQVIKASRDGAFDAAVLDFQFGELTALQVGHFLAEETPIIITSNHPRSSVHTGDWPFDIRDFVAKSKGNVVILKHALEIGGAEPAVSTVVADPPAKLKNWVFLGGVAFALLALIVL